MCHRLNNTTEARSEDNLAKATDIMMIGYKFSDKFRLEAGKVCQSLGGFEVDENPVYIYQFSDMTGSMDCYMAGVTAVYKPVPSQEFVLGITNLTTKSSVRYMVIMPYPSRVTVHIVDCWRSHVTHLPTV